MNKYGFDGEKLLAADEKELLLRLIKREINGDFNNGFQLLCEKHDCAHCLMDKASDRIIGGLCHTDCEQFVNNNIVDGPRIKWLQEQYDFVKGLQSN